MERSKVSLNGDFVLDSSVIIKWFCQEEDTESALLLRENYIRGNIIMVCPDLIIYEIANALRYNKTITKEDVKNSIDSLIDLGITIIVPTKDIVNEAINIAFEYDITIYDAYFIAVAKELRFKFVTADESLYNKIKNLDFIYLLKNFRSKKDYE